MSHAAEASPATRTYVDSAELLSLLGTAGALGVCEASRPRSWRPGSRSARKNG
jgi:hypothetical protein